MPVSIFTTHTTEEMNFLYFSMYIHDFPNTKMNYPIDTCPRCNGLHRMSSANCTIPAFALSLPCTANKQTSLHSHVQYIPRTLFPNHLKHDDILNLNSSSCLRAQTHLSLKSSICHCTRDFAPCRDVVRKCNILAPLPCNSL